MSKRNGFLYTVKDSRLSAFCIVLDYCMIRRILRDVIKPILTHHPIESNTVDPGLDIAWCLDLFIWISCRFRELTDVIDEFLVQYVEYSFISCNCCWDQE